MMKSLSPLAGAFMAAIICAGCSTTSDFTDSGHPVRKSSVAKVQTVRTTAYCHAEADSLPYGRKTAAGTQLRYGRVRSAAADWSRFPLGTAFRIKGEPHLYVVDDYGSALVGTDTIDIYKPSMSAMRAWGVRHVPVEIVRWGSYQQSMEILEGRRHVRHCRQMYESLRRKV
jgi:3D (Asp-Asp-Asp) domain-containing protein